VLQIQFCLVNMNISDICYMFLFRYLKGVVMYDFTFLTLVRV